MLKALQQPHILPCVSFQKSATSAAYINVQQDKTALQGPVQFGKPVKPFLKSIYKMSICMHVHLCVWGGGG